MNKTISFAIVHFSVALSVGWALSGDFLVGGLIAIVEPMVNTVAYHLHEKVWGRRLAKRRSDTARVVVAA